MVGLRFLKIGVALFIGCQVLVLEGLRRNLASQRSAFSTYIAQISDTLLLPFITQGICLLILKTDFYPTDFPWKPTGDSVSRPGLISNVLFKKRDTGFN